MANTREVHEVSALRGNRGARAVGCAPLGGPRRHRWDGLLPIHQPNTDDHNKSQHLAQHHDFGLCDITDRTASDCHRWTECVGCFCPQIRCNVNRGALTNLVQYSTVVQSHKVTISLSTPSQPVHCAWGFSATESPQCAYYQPHKVTIHSHAWKYGVY
jgi:hypothetical protein